MLSARRVLAPLAALAAAGFLLAACQADEIGYGSGSGPKDQRPVSRSTAAAMDKLGVNKSSPVLMRIFKEESTFEVWKMNGAGRYVLIKSYPICRWSGKLGPKVREGDRQAPEGFYPISPGLMNPNSNWYLAFNTGFPNAFDRANGRTGTALMVHGSCSSAGCYAMTDPQIEEIYAFARDAFRGGQKAFQLQAFPFRMTAENMAKHWDDPNMPFWRSLKVGYDSFELTRQEPKVDVCGRRYVFNANAGNALSPVDACPADLRQPADLMARIAAKDKADEDSAAQMFVKIDADRKAAAAREIELAAAADKRKADEAERLRIAEERRIAAQNNPGLLASLFQPAAPAGEAVATGPVVVPPGGAPVPQADPRGSEMHALALAEEEAPPPARAFGLSSFVNLFSFGSQPQQPAPAAPAEAQPVAEPAPVAAVEPASPPDWQASRVVAHPVLEHPAPKAPPARPAAAAPVTAPVTAKSDPVEAATVPVARAAPAPQPLFGTQPAIQPSTTIKPILPSSEDIRSASGAPAAVPGGQAAACLSDASGRCISPAGPGDRTVLDRIGNWF